MKKILFLILLIALSTNVNAAPPTRAYTYVSNTNIDPVQNNANENALYSYLQTGVDTYAAGSITGAAISASAQIPYASLSLSSSIVPGDIASGAVLLPTGAAFFMLTGSCPSGTTDITSTYSNKFIKINATQGTSSGVILTGTSDSTTLTAAQSGLPAHTHTLPAASPNTGGTARAQASSDAADVTLTTSSTGGTAASQGHTHTFSSATTLEPSSVTMKLCVVN